MASARILVVEDEWLIAEDHKDVLEKAGYVVVGPAASVRCAVGLIESEVISAAVLDIGLNGETSAALIPFLTERDIPFVFASGYVPPDVPMELRAYQILPKPVPAVALIQAVGGMLNGKAPC
ncbi:response regulator [Mesorhizobium sp. B4-1-3]|uniref:response regulator n=1 Tax=Mesorhizobium sp. B4-1-3 TaxID=2589889 RepID=UPI00112968A3|nr:response regulator [Mesorhizobium sp. B4-1-3]TPI08722.1 response regulator [Mesorhizobium sp. B4-1-3]